MRTKRQLFRSHFRASLVAAAGALAITYSSAADAPRQGQPMLRISSPAFEANREIPSKFTCEGQDVSPPLAWDGVPDETQSFALIMDDPDAPDPAAPRRTWVHWVLVDLPANARSLPEAVRALPPGTVEGVNDWQRTGYGGPCPPVGRHRYFFKLYALDAVLGDLAAVAKGDVERAMEGHVLAKAELVGTYQKGAPRTA
jgi:Raf kinase inhibitor-like YbhB/YbcL family protein